jgi:hypothetical protein
MRGRCFIGTYVRKTTASGGIGRHTTATLRQTCSAITIVAFHRNHALFVSFIASADSHWPRSFNPPQT